MKSWYLLTLLLVILMLSSYSPDVATHLKHLEQIFERLREVDLKLKMEKCSFLKKHIQYLGHIVSGDGIRPVPEKLNSIQNMPRPYLLQKLNNFWDLLVTIKSLFQDMLT